MYARVSCLLFLAMTTRVGAQEVAPAKDLYGDPLPPGAVARLGSTRFWHSATVRRMVWSPDGRTIATFCSDLGCLDQLRIWKADGQLLHDLKNEAISITAFAFSTDGKIVAFAGGNEVRLWDVARGSMLRKLKGGSACLVFSADGTKLASVSEKIEVWNLRSDKGPELFPRPENVQDLSYCQDGALLGASRMENEVGFTLWNVRTGKTLHTLHHVECGHVSLSSDGKMAVSHGKDSELRLWDVETGKMLRSITRSKCGWPVFSFDCKSVVWEGGGVIYRLDLTTGEETRIRESAVQNNLARAPSPDGKLVAVASSGGIVRILDFATGKELSPIRHHYKIHAAIWTPDGKSVLTGGRDNTLRIWDPVTGRQIRMVVGPRIGNLGNYAFAPDGKLFAESLSDDKLHLWDLALGKVTRRLEAGEWLTKITISPDSRTLAGSGFEDPKRIRFWNLQSGKELPALTDPRKIYSVSFSPDSKLLATMSGDETIGLWNLQTRQLVMRLEAKEASSLAFAADGKTLAIGHGETKISLRDIKTGRVIRTFDVPEKNGTSDMVFSPDGRFLAVAGRSSCEIGDTYHPLCILDVGTGKVLAKLDGHKAFIHVIAFSPDGRSLLSVSSDATGLIWKAPIPTK